MSGIEEPNSLGDIAIVGMTGRFPEAQNVEEFWENLIAGRESIHHFTDEELRGKEIDFDSLKNNLDFVRARGVLDGVDLFDAGFFGFTPRDAAILDPQQRIWLECAWEALELAGHTPDKFLGTIGVFAGSYINSYLLHNLCVDRNYIEGLVRFRNVDAFQTLVSNDKDYLPTRTSYKLNLRGPSINIQTACSTSLVAVCQACQSLLHYETDLALAGGVCIPFPQERGYIHQEGGMLSSDGSCRPFDARANGTVFSGGLGVVVLRRLEDALADGDRIEAVIKGFALNNDGANKVSYGAPSVDGQAEVIARAQALAGVHPETISYIEAHGTGTPLGDPIEIAGLTKAFRLKTEAKQFCGIGSVKSNIGHLDAAAGVAGLIKTVLALKHQQLPPSLHYETANPEIDFEASPFHVIKGLQEWKPGGTPRRAGVSSFGVGGTNAHVVLEESPTPRQSSQTRSYQLLAISAKTETALDNSTQQIAKFLKEHTDVNFGDVAFSLHVGRNDFQHRRFLVCGDREEGSNLLAAGHGKNVVTRTTSGTEPSIVFMFPGQGAQHVQMGHDLYRNEPVFRDNLDRCAEILLPHLDLDLRTLLFPSDGNLDGATQYLKQTIYTQPALFAVEYALAQVWMSWGIKPAAMIGHSVGEYVAACLAGIFSVEDALQLLAHRAKLMQDQPEGSMLAVRLSQDQVTKYLDDEISLAVLNSPMLSVLSGTTERIDALHKQLEALGVTANRLHTSHAYHSKMMEPIVGPFVDAVRMVRRNLPSIPYISSLTGTWITEEQIQDPLYWAHQLRFAVRFSPGILELQKQPGRVLLEVGPGKTLSTLALQHQNPEAKQTVIPSLSHVNEQQADTFCMLTALGHLWTTGAKVDWSNFYADEQRNRLALPTYPFERKRYWVDPPSVEQGKPIQSRECSIDEGNGESLPIPAHVPSEHHHASSISATSVEVTTTIRKGRIVEVLRAIMLDLSGLEFSPNECETSFMELGLDSLFLTQATVQFQKEFGIKVSFRQLFEDLSSLDLLADFLEEKLPASMFNEIPALDGNTLFSQSPVMKYPEVQSKESSLPLSRNLDSQDSGFTDTEVHQELKRMADQLDMVKFGLSKVQTSLSITASSGAARHESEATTQPIFQVKLTEDMAKRLQPKLDVARFGPYKPIEKSKDGNLTKQQEHHLLSLIQRLTAKTKKSKAFAQIYRKILADPRSVAGFRVLWKELVYQIVSERSQGARIWDVDGNEYIDITMGFGANFLGHSPVFVKEAIEEQLHKGIAIGPQSPLAGEVAALLREITGMERVSFCSTGSEAVMAALRMARTITGRTKIAYFTGDYHGMFEEVLARAQVRQESLYTVPAAPGITQESVQNAVVLEYGSPETLKVLEGCAHELAAILVEPIQSRHPELRPKEFLASVRKLTEQTGTALIFDEIITGFRTHPAGLQGLFGIRADLATYGKVIGGGMPIGVVAGSAKFMDSLDGGEWQYGDASQPEVDVTFFAGTFVRHPLALASARAVLRHLKAEGPSLQQTLTQRTERFARELNEFFEDSGVPIRIQQYSSWFRFDTHPSLSYVYLLFYHMLEKGVYIREASQNCFFSTAHSDEDIRFVLQVIKDSVKELQDAGFLPMPPSERNGTINDSLVAGNDNNNVLVEDGWQLASDSVLRGDTQTECDLPLTQAQQEIWLACQMGPTASCAFNESFSIELTGSLDLENFHKSVFAVVNRHEALHFRFSAKEMLQGYTSKLSTDDSLYVVNEGTECDGGNRVREVLAEEMVNPFNLIEGPLFRCTMLKVASDKHVFIFTTHHLVCDGWSSSLLLNEIRVVYSALCQGRLEELPAPGSYCQFVLAQKLDEKKQAAQDSLIYWTHLLSHPPSDMNLPTDRIRPQLRTYTGATMKWEFPAELFKAIKHTARGQQSSLFALVLAAFKALLFRLSGQDDLIVGIPTAGQASLDNQTLVGHCVNLLPIRSTVGGQVSFKSFLSTVKTSILDAYDHQDCTFGRILEELQLPRNPGRIPLVEVTFNLEREGLDESFFNIEAKATENPKHAVIFDLAINLYESENSLLLACFFNTDVFDEQTIKRWLSCYTRLLEGIVANPEQPIGQLALLSKDEQQQLLVEWNQTEQVRNREVCLHELFEAQVRRTPRAVAVVYGEQQLTYEELNHQANQVAHYLRKKGVVPEMLVGLYMERSLDMIIGLLGILKAGGAYVPLDLIYPPERLAFILEDAGAPIVLMQASLREQLPTEQVIQAVCLDREWTAIEKEPGDNLHLAVADDNLAYVIYTSGSTGKPKGVLVPHRAICNHMFWIQTRFSLSGEDRVFQKTPFSFDASVWEFYAPILVGGQLIVARPGGHQEIAYLVEKIIEKQITILQVVPSILQLLVEEPNFKDCKSLRMVFCGGEPLLLELCQRFYSLLDTDLCNLYGPTEACIDSTFWVCPRDAKKVLIGRPIANTQIYLLDNYLQPVPIGVPGELHIGGSGLALGYHNRSELTEEKFIPNPFHTGSNVRLYKTGDLARYLPDGTLECLGRLDYQVKIRGFRIELGEVESVLSQHPDVCETVVVAREDPLKEKRLVAYLVRKNQAKLSIADLRNYLNAILPTYMVPSSFVWLEALPLTPNGKIDRARLPEEKPSLAGVMETYVAPRNPLECELATIWEEVLERRPIGINDNFFDVGGHSLKAFQLFSKIEKRFEKVLPLSILFEAPTIEKLSPYVTNGQGHPSWISLVPIQPNGSKPPLFLVHGIGGNVLAFSNVAPIFGQDQPLYGFQSAGLTKEEKLYTRIEDMAEFYIEELRSVQSQGPYFLGGACMGGLVAFEMAQQLQRQGDEVAFLGLFDTWLPDRSEFNTYSMPRMKYLEKKFQSQVKVLTEVGIKAWIPQALEKLKALPEMIEEGDVFKKGEKTVRARALVTAANFKAVKNYAPKLYNGKITYFEASVREVDPKDDTRMEWARFASRGFECFNVPASDSGDMFKLPSVQTLAGHVKSCLEWAQEQCSAKSDDV